MNRKNIFHILFCLVISFSVYPLSWAGAEGENPIGAVVSAPETKHTEHLEQWKNLSDKQKAKMRQRYEH